MNEAAFKNSVIEVATRYGWFVHHDLPAMNRRGAWATHVQGNTGFPDLVLLNPKGVLVFAELKRTPTSNPLSSSQAEQANNRKHG